MDRFSRILSSLVNNETVSSGRYSGYDLSAIRELLALSGNPHRDGKFVHIAGTNGKGSTAWMLASILRAAGIRAGLYTSPHLLTIHERIRVDMLPVGDEDLENYTGILEKHLGSTRNRPTWFDAVTWAAFCHFSVSDVDIAIMETGLGGRLDSTNVITPELSVITEIAMDHAAILGDGIEKIAHEKAGIIKPGVPVIAAGGTGASLDVIRERAAAERASLIMEGDHFQTSSINPAEGGGTRFNFRCESAITGSLDIKDIYMTSDCMVQARNAGIAITAAEILTGKPAGQLEPAVRKAFTTLSIPGRCEKLRKDPTVYFDPAHNPAALKMLLDSIRHLHPGHKLTAAVSFMEDKDHATMFSLLHEYGVKKVAYHVLEDPRCYVPGTRLLKGFSSVILAYSSRELFEFLEQQCNNNVITLFTGSFRLYSMAREFIAYLEAGKQEL